METALIYDDCFLQHHTGRHHPECPQRLEAIVRRLHDTQLWDRLEHPAFGPADWKWIEQVHTKEYIRRLRGACEQGRPFIDEPDSAICRESFGIAQVAVGGVLAGVDAVMTGAADNAFCAVRPPGHHAERDRSMGFCLFNNIAVAAEYLRGQHGLERVAIVDFDVHHGNGTQHVFEARDDVLFVSLHEHPHYQYPGTGFAEETGVDGGKGFTLNIPLQPHSDDAVYRQAFEAQVLPAVDAFQPQCLLVSAGFDAHELDPLGHQQVSDDGFVWMAQQLHDAAKRLCQGRLLVTLEGGYHLEAQARCVEAMLRVLLGSGT